MANFCTKQNGSSMKDIRRLQRQSYYFFLVTSIKCWHCPWPTDFSDLPKCSTSVSKLGIVKVCNDTGKDAACVKNTVGT